MEISLLAPIVETYDCGEYLAQFSAGRYDVAGQFWFILPVSDITLNDSREALIVGRAGVDGICFCYRAGAPALWAWFPLDERWQRVSNCLADLERSWLAGELRV